MDGDMLKMIEMTVLRDSLYYDFVNLIINCCELNYKLKDLVITYMHKSFDNQKVLPFNISGRHSCTLSFLFLRFWIFFSIIIIYYCYCFSSLLSSLSSSFTYRGIGIFIVANTIATWSNFWTMLCSNITECYFISYFGK